MEEFKTTTHIDFSIDVDELIKAAEGLGAEVKETFVQAIEYLTYCQADMLTANPALESLNSDLKVKLNLHKGLTKERRKVLIRDFLNAHSPDR